MDRFKNCDLATGSVSLWAVFEVSKPHTIPSSFSLFLVGGGSSQLLLLPSLPPAAMIPCHDALFSLWNYKSRLPSRSCLAHGVLSEIRKVANTPAYRLSSMGKKKKMNVLSANHSAWSIFPFPAIGEERRRTHIHQCFKVVGRCIGPGVLS